MLNDHRATTSRENGRDHGDDDDDEQIRDIHALTPPHPLPPPPAAGRHRRREAWETGSHRSSNLSVASEGGASSTENFTTMSREFSALVLAGSSMDNPSNHDNNDGGTNNGTNNLARIGEEGDQSPEESNPLAIVLDNNPLDPAPSPRIGSTSGSNTSSNNHSEVSVQRVKKEEVETKISAWQNAKIAKINNRFKREDAIINGWESEQVQKASSWMKKVERKLEEKRAKALEKMQNDIAKAHRKAEERRASSEAKRGTKVARVLEIANLMKAVGKPPTKRSFF